MTVEWACSGNCMSYRKVYEYVDRFTVGRTSIVDDVRSNQSSILIYRGRSKSISVSGTTEGLALMYLK
jgi:hypothetical protein